jgi:dihydroanticapsin dehydrogenase
MVHKDLGLDASGLQRAAFPVIPPEQLARHALFLASPVSAPINGTSLLVDFGFAGRTAFPTLDFAAP